jgi:hypothetical protein
MLLEERVTRRGDERPTEIELQAIAKAEFENQRARYCDQQREHPQHHLMHSAANAAYADYYQRMIDTGGRPALELADEAALATKGYSAERIDRLRTLIELHSDQPAIQPNTAIFHLRRLGFEPSRLLIETVKRALYPAYRDAALSAQEQLEEMLVGRDNRVLGPHPPQAPAVRADISEPPEQTVVPTPRDEESNPWFSDLCRQAADEKESAGEWTAKTARQRRSLGLLFELLVGRKRVAEITQADLSTFKTKRRLITEKLSPSLEKERLRITELTSRKLTPQEIKVLKGAPHAKTINRDLTGISAVLKWGDGAGKRVPELKIGLLRAALPADSRARDDRPPTSDADLKLLFSLPIFTGCLPHEGGKGRRVLNCRFTSGTTIVHDAFYWVPSLVNYLGARREEVCKLAPTDFHLDVPVPYVRIDFTETGRIKNGQSKRNLPLHPELLRLGIREYVEEAARRGYRELFPELAPTNAVETYGDQFYDLCWTHMRRRGGLTPDADIHGIRHTFNSDLKDKRVAKEFRSDMLGHGGEDETDERYTTPAALRIMLEEMEKLPMLTEHLRTAPLNMPPKLVVRPNPNMKRKR